MPGETQLTRMPYGSSSTAMARVSASTAPFDAEYTARSTRPTDATTEHVLTTTPRPAARITGRPARDMLATPNTLTANTRSQSSGVDATTSPTAPMPALLQSTSMRPCSATTRSVAARQSSGSRHVDTVEQVEPDDDVAGRR